MAINKSCVLLVLCWILVMAPTLKADSCPCWTQCRNVEKKGIISCSLKCGFLCLGLHQQKASDKDFLINRLLEADKKKNNP